jgi:hypothetical protein
VSEPGAVLGTVLQRSGTVLTALGLLAAALFVILWSVRARNNAEVLSPRPHRLDAGWALAGWFVPLANAVVPVIVVADLVRACGGASGESRSVAFWWAGWIGGSLAMSTWLVVEAVSTSSSDGSVPTPFLIIAAILYVMAAVAFTAIATGVAKWQDEILDEPRSAVVAS